MSDGPGYSIATRLNGVVAQLRHSLGSFSTGIRTIRPILIPTHEFSAHLRSMNRSPAQIATSQANGARSHGPRSKIGRSRSSLSAVRGGLTAFGVILPGERLDEFRRHLNEWVETLQPENGAEDQVVFAIADLMWRLRRLGRREDSLVKAHLQKLTKEIEVKMLYPAQRAHTVFSQLADLIRTTKAPATVRDLAPLLDSVRTARGFLDEVSDLPSHAAVRLDDAIHAIDGSSTRKLDPTLYAALGEAASTVVGAIELRQEKARKVVQAQVDELSRAELLVDEKQAKRLERARKLLDESMLRQLDILSVLKRQKRRRSTSSDNARRELPLLRIVR